MASDVEALRIVEEALAIDDRHARDEYLFATCAGQDELLTRVQRLMSYGDRDLALLPTLSLVPGTECDDEIPARIGPFRVIREIARGGMGTVVLAQRADGLFEQTVAIKLIRVDIAHDRVLARFAEERRILARLNHPSIVRIIDGGEVDGRPWLAMDFVDGMPVDLALDQRGASLLERLRVFETICETVAFAHRRLVVHADIKPSNVLMDAEGRIYLLDFGIARLIEGIDASAAATVAHYPLTRRFSAPERLAGEAPTVAGDVFSLGMLLMAMLGHRTWPGTSPVVPGTHLPHGLLTGDLAAMVGMALAEDPAARYPDPSAFASDVRRHLAHVPVRARGEASWHYRAGRFVLRHRLGLLLTSVAGMALAALAITATVQSWRADAARAEANARFADARGVARYLLYDLIPSLEHSPRSLPQRVEAAGQAQRYLERLAATADAPDGLRFETADGLLHLAMLQGRNGRPNLGLADLSERNLERAEAIALPLPGRDARELIARIRIERVRLAAWMKGDVETAEALAMEARAAISALGRRHPALEREFAIVLAELRGWQGRFAEQEAAADRSLALMPDIDSGMSRLDRARALSLKAEAAYYLKRPDEALAMYRDSSRLVGLAVSDAGESSYFRGRQAVVAWEVGTTLTSLGRYDEAIPTLRSAEAFAARAAELEPSDRNARRQSSVMRVALAQALGLAGRTDEAIARIRAHQARLRGLLETEGTPVVARDLAYSHTLVGEALIAGKRTRAACAADREAMVQFDQLRRRGLLTPFDEDVNLRILRDRMATNCPG